MKKLTYTGEEILNVSTGEWDYVLRPGQSVEVSNEVAEEYENRADVDIRDTKSKKGGD